ncbi:MAG: phage portal protein, partial [Alphaproteobacteria bacterium]
MHKNKKSLKNLFNIFSPKLEIKQQYSQSLFYNLDDPVWTKRDYSQFAEQAYIKNVIANRCINMIAQSAANVPWCLYKKTKTGKIEIKDHPILKLLDHPNPTSAGAEFFENIYAYKLISGNAYILSINIDNKHPNELHLLRPDKVTIIPGDYNLAAAYKYTNGSDKTIYPVNVISGQSTILHLRNFHPLDDWYGLSPIEAASYSIDQHNQAAMWNQSLLQNGARPSGAIIVKTANDGSGGVLSEEQFIRLKEQIDEKFTGTINAGRPLLLEGGLEWKEMSLTPKDMDFIEAKNSAARDIALAFGVPPQLLGIPGDNTYRNMREARLALWEETILPLLDH